MTISVLAADLKCWAYSPPGGLVSRELSEAMRPFTTSIAVGKDGVPRLSLKNLARMLDELITALARCRKPATSVMLNYRRYKHEKRSNILFLPENEVPQEALDYLHRQASVTMFKIAPSNLTMVHTACALSISVLVSASMPP